MLSVENEVGHQMISSLIFGAIAQKISVQARALLQKNGTRAMSAGANWFRKGWLIYFRLKVALPKRASNVL